MKHYTAGSRLGKRMAGGSIVDPWGVIHRAAVNYAKVRGGSLADVLEMQRQFKAGAWFELHAAGALPAEQVAQLK